MRRLVFLGIFCFQAAFAGEYAVLESGLRLKVDHHERAGDRIRLFTSKDGFIELPASSIVNIEAEEYTAPPPAAPPAASTASALPPSGATTPAPAKLSPKELVQQAALNNGLPPEFVHQVVKAESGYRQDAISPKGAIGMMQLMPQTAAALNADPHNAEQNVEAGTRHLRELLLQYKEYPDQVRRALAAYNAGPGAVQKYNGVPPYRETQLYVNKIIEGYRKSLTSQPAAH